MSRKNEKNIKKFNTKLKKAKIKNQAKKIERKNKLKEITSFFYAKN
ncbi:hypothetical protein [Flavobacterium columnare]|uniref:Uncharacterized protein n=1 Tax=Flavobacterium davisii TaxID=2906077 RepID=A0ABW8PMQ9_9FLAO|nr:hypothetical protein [Flavobacterium columnare]